MSIEYIAMQTADGEIHINTVDTNDKIKLAANVKQYPTLIDVFKVFKHRTAFNFMNSEDFEGSSAAWNKKATYNPNDLVFYEGRTWLALPDVAVGYAPDDIYDEEFFKQGGWAPLENKAM